MPAPTVATFSLDALVSTHTAFKALIDSGGSAGSVRVRSATDVLLAQVPLSYPCGTVNGATGQLVFSIAGPDASADADGTAAYVEVCTSAGVVKLSLPAQAGAVAVPGKAVLNTLAILAAGTVEVTALTVG